MVSIEEKVEFESEEIPLRVSQTKNKIQTLNCERPHILAHPKFSSSWILRTMHQISVLRSVPIVLIKAKINILLPFGPLTIMLHYTTNKHGWVFFFSLLDITPLAERLGYATELKSWIFKVVLEGEESQIKKIDTKPSVAEEAAAAADAAHATQEIMVSKGEDSGV